MEEAALGAGSTPPEAEEYALQVRRILDSQAFQTSPLLKLFLEFVTSEALNGRAENISEYSIATRVLGRRDDFDPTSAAVVRTQAYRLRRKLAEYYRTEGAKDPIVIELPKGHYYPAFSRRTAGSEVQTAPEAAGGAPRWRAALPGLIAFAAGLVIGASLFSRPSSVTKPALPPGVLSQFWGEIVSSGRPVIIAFANPVYLANSFGDLFNPRSASAGMRGEPAPLGLLKPPLDQIADSLYYEDGFTGTGEVFAMNRLTSLLEKAGATVVVRRNRTVTAEDLRNHDVVFVGSGRAVQALQNIRLLKRFEVSSLPASAGLWRTQILDRGAPSGPAAVYQVSRDPATQILKSDYAVLAALPGIVPPRRIVLMAGLTTSGTQGAAEYATSEHNLKNLAAALGGARLPRDFEAVLRIDVARGIDPVNASFVAGGAVRAGD